MKRIMLFFAAFCLLAVTTSWAAPAATLTGDIITSGPWVDVRAFANVSTAKVYAKTNNRPLHITKAVSCHALSFDGVEVDIISGGTINNSGTVSGLGNFHAGLARVFVGSGPVSGLQKALPEWWTTNATPGTTDMSAAWQAALNTMAPVYLQKTTYLVGDVSYSGRVYVYGAGGRGISDNTTVRLKAGAAHILTAGFVSTVAGDDPATVTGGEIAGIKFDGQSQVATALVFIATTSHCNIHDCSFQSLQGRGLSLQRVMESRVDGNLFRDVGVYGSGALAIEAVTPTGYLPGDCNNLHIEQNTFAQISGSPIWVSNTGNLDACWISRNKLEYDGVPTWTNAGNTPVIALGQVGRISLTENMLANYSASNNNFGTMIQISAGGGSVHVSGNKLYQCSGIFIDQRGGTVTEDDNTNASDNALTYAYSSFAYQHYGDSIRWINTSGAAMDYPYTTAPSPLDTFMPAINSRSLTTQNIVIDAAALSPTHGVKTVTSGGTFDEFAILNLGAYFDYPNMAMLSVSVRVKAPADSSVQLYVDATGYANTSVPSASGWMWVTWNIQKSALTSSSVAKLYATNVNGILFDGAIIRKLHSVTGSITWDPPSIAAGSGATSSGVTVTGAAVGDQAVVAYSNGTLGGMQATAYITATDNAVIRLDNNTGISVDLSSGTWTVRVFK
ncbi:MAG TPA: right-handed parallel beta-helix repeat-containing protein [Geobacteraceae bacterium]